MTSIKTLKADIEHVLNTGEGYTKEIAEWVGDQIAEATKRQLSPRQGKGTLRMSNLGTPCERKLWYTVQEWDSDKVEKLSPYAKNKFIFGDIIEAWTLGLVLASGHKLEGMQDKMEINGILGSRDCVIDGITFDVKSASTMSMSKFNNNGLKENDPFGYLSQLSSYVHAGKDDPLVINKTHGGFLAVDKQFGHVVVDIYDLSDYIGETKEKEVERKKYITSSSKLPKREFTDVPDGKSGNMKLGTNCSYCEFKSLCWPNLQTYVYSNGPRFLTQVVREPKVFKED